MRTSSLSNIGRAKVPEIELPLILASSKVKEDEVNEDDVSWDHRRKVGNHRQPVNPSDVTCLPTETWREQLSSKIRRKVWVCDRLWLRLSISLLFRGIASWCPSACVCYIYILLVLLLQFFFLACTPNRIEQNRTQTRHARDVWALEERWYEDGKVGLALRESDYYYGFFDFSFMITLISFPFYTSFFLMLVV